MIRTALGIVGQNLRTATGRRGLPRILTWTVNFRCNARCGMCDSWKKTGEDEMGTEQALELVRKLPRSITAARLTGGEPFLRDDLERIALELDHHLPLDLLHLTTNGFRTERIVSFVSRMGRSLRAPLQILVSLDGMEELHNEIRGRPFAFHSAVETLREIARIRRNLGVEIAVNQTVVDERGIAQYDELHELLRSLDVPHHVVVAYAESATYSTAKSTDLSPKAPGAFRTATPMDPERFRTFMDRVQADTRELPWTNGMAKSYYLEGIRNRVLHGRGVPNPSCAALAGHLRIYPDGSVPTCQFNSNVVGNLVQTDFDTLWNSEPALAGRAWVEKCPGCWAECEVLPSAVLGGDLVLHRFRKGVAA
jgi:MoaA/NifB/PqqE/SkfB family radical SAM enzyme